MRDIPNLICGKSAIGGNINTPRDNNMSSNRFLRYNTKWEKYVNSLSGYRSYIEIYADKNGIEKTINWMENNYGMAKESEGGAVKEKEEFKGQSEKEKPARQWINYIDAVKILRKALISYHTSCEADDNQQFQVLYQLLYNYYIGRAGDGYEDKYMTREQLRIMKQDTVGIRLKSKEDFAEECMVENPLGVIAYIVSCILDRSLVVRCMCEEYGRSFWKIWGELRECIRTTERKPGDMWNLSDNRYPNVEYFAAPKISTEDYLSVDSDDMIYYWTPRGAIHFSADLCQWFGYLEKEYGTLLKNGIPQKRTEMDILRWILDLMKYANEEYYHIYTFESFFGESTEHLLDPRYIALWRLFEKMLYSQEYKKSGDVIWYYPKKEDCEQDLNDGGQNRILEAWNIRERKNNKARVNLRRYMALMANMELRKRVFGF